VGAFENRRQKRFLHRSAGNLRKLYENLHLGFFVNFIQNQLTRLLLVGENGQQAVNPLNLHPLVFLQADNEMKIALLRTLSPYSFENTGVDSVLSRIQLNVIHG
jgi:hypothetical protein